MSEQSFQYRENEELINEVQALINDFAEDEPQAERAYPTAESVKIGLKANLSKVAFKLLHRRIHLNTYTAGSGSIMNNTLDPSARDGRRQVQLDRGDSYFRLNPDTQMYERIKK